MSTLAGKHIILGICGSIAAYKSAYLCRSLIKEGAKVKVVMTRSATDFVQALTFSTLSGQFVTSDISSGDQWNNHVKLGLWADLFVIAPTTANTLAKMSAGIADNLLVATYLSAKCPVMIAPAMDLDMWKHPSTKRNISQLKNDGAQFIDVGHGELASGLVGDGRMAEPEVIMDHITAYLGKKKVLNNQKILVTAGPTYEDLDPVRFIGNRSTGKMGIAIASAAADAGAEVHLVLGPTSQECPANIHEVYQVRSAKEMYKTCRDLFPKMHAAIMAAAVADYTPSEFSDQKIKKETGNLSIALDRTKDIAASLGKFKEQAQVMIGFALETENGLQQAKNKLERKKFDMIVLNSLEDEGAGFGHDTNKVQFVFPSGQVEAHELKSKKKVAEDIIAALKILLDNRNTDA